MSPDLSRSQKRVVNARRTLAFQRDLARAVRSNERLHRFAMQRVFLCEESLFLLLETQDMIARLEAQRAASNRFQFGKTDIEVKAASGL